MSDKLLTIEPNKPSGSELWIKSWVGLVIWIGIAFFIFVCLILVGSMFQEALRNRLIETVSTVNPLLPLILIVIAFLATLIGNIMTTWIYSLLFGQKYYDFSKMIYLVSVNNIILFFLFAPIYIIYYNRIEVLFMVLWFHIFFSVFLSNVSLDISSNPNYAGVALIGSAAGLSLSLVLFGVLFKTVDLSQGGAEKIILIAPCIIAYIVIPLVASIWEKLYYGFYQVWNNFLYIPSLDEVMVDQEEVDEINVE